MSSQHTVFDSLGALETVLARLKQLGLRKEAAALSTVISGVLDRAIERGDNLREDNMINAALEDGNGVALLPIGNRNRFRKAKVLTASTPKLKRTKAGKEVWVSLVRYRDSQGHERTRMATLGTTPDIRPQLKLH